MRKRNKQNRFVRSLNLKIRNVQYHLKSLSNALAVILVLFLAFIAAILYLNDRYLSEKETESTVQSLTPPAYAYSKQVPSASPSFIPTPRPATGLISRGDSISSEKITPVPTPEVVITPIQVSSSISTVKDYLSPSPDAASPKPTKAPHLESSPPVPSLTSLAKITPPVTPQEPQPTSIPAITPKPTPEKEVTPLPAVTPITPEKTASTRKASDKEVLVVIDPGHGGKDPGTCSIYKEELLEKDINLDIALKLKAFLESSKVPILMTRESDNEEYLTTKYDYSENLRIRPEIANRNNATLFVSIHVNAYDTKLPGGEKYHGTEVYYTDKVYGSLTNKQFAELMGKAIDRKTETKYNGVIQRSFTVLRLSNMPALLIETAYLTNKEDHRRLESDTFRSSMAEGIHDGIIEIIKAMGAYMEKETWLIP